MPGLTFILVYLELKRIIKLLIDAVESPDSQSIGWYFFFRIRPDRWRIMPRPKALFNTCTRFSAVKQYLFDMKRAGQLLMSPLPCS